MITSQPSARTAWTSVAVVLALTAGCTQTTDLERTQAQVRAETEAVEEATDAYESARGGFCRDASQYVAALDRYSKLFTDSSATVGDVRTLGSDLERPQSNVMSSAQDAVDAHTTLVEAQADLAAAQAELESLQSGSSATESPSTTTTTTTLLPAATVDRIATEEEGLETALSAVTDQTPLTQAGQQVNAAAFALQAAWMRVLVEAGCLTDEQRVQAEQAVTEYTAAVQSALKVTGHFTGAVDGIYGPETVAAVQAFQTEHQLPATGYVDIATTRALQLELAQEGTTAAGQATAQAIAYASSVQTALTLAGYWTGTIDGQWTAELTAALQSFQSALDVPSTGTVDAATLAALQQAIADAKTTPDTTTSAPGSTLPEGTDGSATTEG